MRSHSRSIFRSDGAMPCMGEITPPKTWYRPRYWWVFSIESRSATCSTTQTVVRSRSSLWQMGQSSVSERLLHRVQCLISWRKRSMARVIPSTDSHSILKRCIARRKAVLRPMPGSFCSSPTTSCNSCDIAVRSLRFYPAASTPSYRRQSSPRTNRPGDS